MRRAMASKWINAMLWTLVSVNLITLVLGGLITWLGYAIPSGECPPPSMLVASAIAGRSALSGGAQ